MRCNEHVTFMAVPTAGKEELGIQEQVSKDVARAAVERHGNARGVATEWKSSTSAAAPK